MARATVLAPASRPNWWMVEDGLKVRHEVQSAVDGYEYGIGQEYRLFTPDGAYQPRRFRLLPFSTSRGWRDARATAATHPATAAALYLYKDKMTTHLRHDMNRTIQSVTAGKASFVEGGSAALDAGEATLYQPGDVVAVIHDRRTAGTSCLRAGNAEPWIAGFGGGQSPRPADQTCGALYEDWAGYQGTANLIQGGASLPPLPAAPGVWIYRKENPPRNAVTWWEIRCADAYLNQGSPFGALASATAVGGLALDAGAAPLSGPAAFYALEGIYPRPMLMPSKYRGTSIIAPPLTAVTRVIRKTVCGGRHLKMTVNLATASEPACIAGSNGEGLALPACLVLVFEHTPSDFLGPNAANPTLFTGAGGAPIWHSAQETNMDRRLKLVYAAPGTADVSGIRASLIDSAATGRYALARPIPRRLPGGGVTNVRLSGARAKFNAPMDDPETGAIREYGALLTRMFDMNGGDVTPAPFAGSGGFFGGYFETEPNMDVTRDLYADLTAAYPFLDNPALNPARTIPRLSEIVFYAQSKITVADGGAVGISRSALFCGGFSFFYE